jgi:hypothetical protein
LTCVRFSCVLAHYIFNFTKSGAKKGKSLAEQAGALLEARLWGIGSKTQNRERLAPGDRILAYVGAPEKLFVGAGTLSSGTHDWTAEESQRYPGDWIGGVSLSEVEIWERPVVIGEVWPSMSGFETNANAQFFAGILQIKQNDYEQVVAAAKGLAPKAPETKPESAIASSAPVPKSTSDAELNVAALYEVAEKLNKFLAENPSKKITEDATRAMFVNPLLHALGYTAFEDIDYGVQVESKDFADYVLNIKGKPGIVVEAKRLGANLGAKEAAQAIKYASVLGVRWGLLTDGSVLRLYDRIPSAPPEDRLVFELDLTDHLDREDFEVKLYPDLALLSKSAMEEGTGLERRAAQQAVRDLLVNQNSKTIAALREELTASQLAHVDKKELVELLDELL